MKTITITSHKKDEIIDITEDVEKEILSQTKNEGVVLIHALHTTCCITTADLDPGTDKDLLDFLRAIEPKLSYRHPHNPSHAPDHIISSIIGPSISIPFQEKQLVLGTWQRVILIELDGPRKRNITVSII
ncbi:MAG: secondary thiamine-phosphate synthase enzyme YjbQ [bacterium]|nr:secondary thiamine-phosphate synthase enzyme YjbQ [bacterium]